MIITDTKEKEARYSLAYKELYLIILNLNKEMREKIPKNVVENIESKMDKTYDFNIEEGKDIFSIEYMLETKALFLELYTRYIAEDEEEFWEVYKEKRNGLLKKEIEKEYLVRKYDNDNDNNNSIKTEDSIDEVNNIIEAKENKNLLLAEIREKNIIEKIVSGIRHIIMSIFS